MTKKIIKNLLLIVAMVVMCLAMSTTVSAEVDGYYTYSVHNGKATIINYNGDEKNVVIPSELGGYVVKAIDYSAFYGCTNLKSVEIPDSVISIGGFAFNGCTNLETVNLPKSVVSIGEYAFAYCTSITEFIGTEGLNIIHNNAFEGCSSLEKVMLPETVTYIYDGAFANCVNLREVSIPVSASYPLGGYAGVPLFKNCDNVEKFTFTKGNGKWQNELCYDESLLRSIADSLKEIILEDGIENICYNAFADCNFTNIEEIIIPDSVTSIDAQAFFNCNLNVVLPKNMIFIGERSFFGCSNIIEINIPESVEIISKNAFENCTKIKSVNITDLDSWCRINFGGENANPLTYGAKLYCNGEKVTDVVFPDDITGINPYAFVNCSTLKSVTIPVGIITIGQSAFGDCTSLKVVNYSGTQDEWDEIIIGLDNSFLKTAMLHLSDHEVLIVKETPATCTQNGYTAGTYCVDCDYWFDGHKIIPSLDTHSYGEWTTVNEATCSSEGVMMRFCSCGLNETKTMDKEEHNYSDWSVLVAPDCIQDGVEIRTCEECENNEFRIAKATGHSYSDEFTVDVEATCITEGSKSRHCTVCDAKTDVTVIEANNYHRYVDITVLPTCTAEGYTIHICAYCDDTYKDVADATGHTEREISGISPTCYEAGVTDGAVCSVCETILVAQEEIPPTSHNDSDNNGYCDYCDEDLIEEEKNCSCNCHQSGFIGFIWKIINFFNKLFKSNKICACGIAHY